MAGAELDPFNLVVAEVQVSVNKLQATFERWEQRPKISIQDFLELSKELYTGCENIEWQVDELDRAIAVAERYPSRFSLDGEEIERRKKWTSSTHNQICTIRTALQIAASEGLDHQAGNWEELKRLPDHQSILQRNRGAALQNDDLSSETVREAFVLRGKDVQDFDHLNDAVGGLGEVNLEILTEMSNQDRLLEHDFLKNMDHSPKRLDCVRKRIAKPLKKYCGFWNTEIIPMVILVGLLIILLTYLVFSGNGRSAG